MLIKNVEYIPVTVPRSDKWRTALGAHAFGDAAVVIIHGEKDTFGIGEISSIWDSYASGLVRDIGQKLKESVLGSDIFDIMQIHRKMDSAVRWNKSANCVKAGIEMAIYDLIGKQKDLPVYDLIGGKMRNKIPVSRSIGMGTVDMRIEQINYYRSLGYRTVKIKTGNDIEDDTRTIEAIREACGDSVAIRVDANMGWNEPKAVLKLLDKLYEFNVISVEQPLPPDDIDGLVFLKDHSKMPIMADESLWGPADALRLIKSDAVDIMNVYVSEAGGLSKAMLIAGLCDIAGIGFCIGSMPELGIGTAAAIHLGVAAPQINHPCDLVGSTYFKDDIIEEKIPFNDGYVYSIDSPGLGVSLDWNKINRYRLEPKDNE